MPCADRVRYRPRRKAQTLTPDLFRPVPDGFVAPQDLPLRRTADPTGNPAIDKTGDRRQ